VYRRPAYRIAAVLHLIPIICLVMTAAAAAEPQPTRQLAFSPDGRHLAAAFGLPDQPGTFAIWDWEAGTPVIVHHEDVGIATVSFSPSGQQVAIGMFGPAAKLVSPKTGEVIREFHGHTGHARSVAFVNEDLLATGSYDHSVRLWDAASGDQLAELGIHTGGVRDIAASPDGKWLISGASAPDVVLWNIDKRGLETLFMPSNMICPTVAFSRDGTLLLTGRWDTTVRIRDATLHTLRATIKTSSRGLALSPDNRALLVVDDTRVIKHFPVMFDPPSDDLQRRIETLIAAWDDDDYHKREQASRELIALGLAAEPQLHEAMHSDVPEIRIRARRARASVLSPEPEVIDVGHQANIGAVAFSPDGRHVASGDAHGTVKVWELHSRQPTADLRRPEQTDD
jgi:WD40 repeat protein